MMGVWLVSRVSFGHYDGCLVSNVRLNDDNLTLDDEFHLATMMGVWLVFSHYDGCLVSVRSHYDGCLVSVGHYDGCLVSGFSVVSGNGCLVSGDYDGCLVSAQECPTNTPSNAVVIRGAFYRN